MDFYCTSSNSTSSGSSLMIGASLRGCCCRSGCGGFCRDALSIALRIWRRARRIMTIKRTTGIRISKKRTNSIFSSIMPCYFSCLTIDRNTYNTITQARPESPIRATSITVIATSRYCAQFSRSDMLCIFSENMRNGLTIR